MKEKFDEYYKDCKPMEGKMKHKVIKCEICHNHSYANLYLKALEIAILKRGLHGVYHHASKKHLARYVNEFTFRLNDGNVSNHTMQRLESLVLASFGKRLSYETLTG